MKLQQVAAQLYTIRDFCKTPADLAASLKKIRAIGYQSVQVSGICSLPESELLQMLKGEGLTCCATHEPSDDILDKTDFVIEHLQRLGCTLAAYPYPSGVDFGNEESIATLIKKLAAAGRKFHENGLSLSYHNHSIEFIRSGSETILDRIYREIPSPYLSAELDTYWVQCGGGDPVAWCTKMNGRLHVVHAKDYAWTPENKTVFAEVGKGNLNFPAITQAAISSGMKWFVVEQDTCPGDPFDSLRLSFDYVKKHLVTA